MSHRQQLPFRMRVFLVFLSSVLSSVFKDLLVRLHSSGSSFEDWIPSQYSPLITHFMAGIR